jgi:hypothetical protein
VQQGFEHVKFDFTYQAPRSIVDVQISKNNKFLITISYNESVSIIELIPESNNATNSSAKNEASNKPGFQIKNFTLETIRLADLISNQNYLNDIVAIKSALTQKNGDF